MALRVARRGAVDPFIVMEVLRAANERMAAGEAVIHMEIGQPSTPAPLGVRRAAQAALEADRLGYTDALGIAPLREAIAAHYARRHGVAVDPARVAVTIGSSGGFVLAFLTAFDAGDRVVLTDPSYPCYRNMLASLGIEVVHVPTGPETRFQPTPALLDRVPGRIDGLVVASPSNPTGSMLDAAEIAALAGYCEARGIRLVSDEIYHGLTYGRREATALAASRSAIVVNSFSKYFSMTGWRVGWLVLPEDLVSPVERMGQNLFINAPTLSQLAAVAAFDCTDELEGNVRRYAENRALLLEALPRAGFGRFAEADGAFYFYCDIAHLTNDSRDFCRRMLAETGVAATPGLDFDPARGATTMRFSYAGATADMAEAARRLERWIRR